MKALIKKFAPDSLFTLYYLMWAYFGALLYRFPSNKLFVIAVTGTKGKSTTVELLQAILKEAGYKTASASTIRFTVAETSERNLFKMTMPGRMFLQSFLRRAVDAGCTHVVVEMTSEGAKQFRHKGISLDALVFLNLQPEHLESHGGMEQYAAAKLLLAKQLEESSKRPRYIVANADDKYGARFLAATVERSVPFSLKNAEPYNTDDKSVRFVWNRELITVPLPGLFNLQNILAALSLADAMGVPLEASKRALERIEPIAGRAERVQKGQNFTVIVDYAHTPDSLKALYETFKNSRIIALLGSTGGGRDKWKRPLMGSIAEQYADAVFLANEDPYDENPQTIVNEIAKGFTKRKPFTILDRRAAIREALREAKPGDAVLITGKGTDPYIMGANGTKQEWSDKKVVEEELSKMGYH
ncbi:MAG: UDP-N-acetylmuramoyl-L-alanyl-D-glutamate--2,6-diaminopimelate ligase [Candidatus Pacebacteria bacterium]|nr:UDP-N-acetylmuramoyl-L-alanyl-D-glutamate--2,6-diaminopimelate ligase [Candidatus Paceibacterota bacterium]